jgi:histidinol-phosphate aminotransferase
VVVIDEAYIDFGGESAVGLVARYPQLLVTRTLSKSHALAGLRVGYAIGQPHLIEALNRVKDSFNSYPLDRFAQAGALASLQDHGYFEALCARVIATRSRLVAAMSGMGFEVLPSTANFIFARHPAHDGAELAAGLRERSIIVRHFKQPARIASFLRITIGTDAQCDALIAALKTLVAC